jgi:hypothetical protein
MREEYGFILALVILVSVLCGAYVFSSYQEAKVYTKLTGKNVTTWDALWVDLRVQDSAK